MVFWPVSETQLKADPAYLYAIYRESPFAELRIAQNDPYFSGRQKSESSQLLEVSLETGKKVKCPKVDVYPSSFGFLCKLFPS